MDDDVLQAAKELAAARRRTAGQVVSEPARKGLEPEPRGCVRMFQELGDWEIE